MAIKIVSASNRHQQVWLLGQLDIGKDRNEVACFVTGAYANIEKFVPLAIAI